MALITCPKCGGQISDTAEKCVHCGFAFKKCLECGAIVASENERYDAYRLI